MTISVTCSELLILLVTNLVWQCMFISRNVLWKGCFVVFRSRSQWWFWTTVNVCLDNISDRSNLVWWCIIISQSVMWKYHFAMFKVKATIISTRSSEILKLLQSKLVWWYIITRQGKIPWKDFLAFTQGMRQRIWLGWLWTRLLPLLPIPISILVPIKKMWKEHCFCNECTCLLILLVNGSSISFCTWDDVYITCETDY